jgi:hypothetical protein
MATLLPTGGVVDPVLSFLNLAGEVHEAAVSIHNDHQDSNRGISQLFTTLTTTVECLRDETSRGDDEDILIHTCVKVGQDLLIRLGRVQSFRETSGPDADLRVVWPAAAVDSLGDRIQDLHYRWYISM